MNIIWDPQEIERKSMSIIEEAVPELAQMSLEEQAIIKRVVHTTGDPSCAKLVKISSQAIESGLQAIRSGCNILTDVHMLQSGLIRRKLDEFGMHSYCLINDPEVVKDAKDAGITRAMAAIRKGSSLVNGGIVAIGNAPTALFTLCDMIEKGEVSPALVVGTPVGFVGAAESKEVLAGMDIPYITIPGTRGGSTIAVTIVNALLLLA